MSGVLTVAAGAVEGFGTVYNGLEKSAAVLGNSILVISHFYHYKQMLASFFVSTIFLTFSDSVLRRMVR